MNELSESTIRAPTQRGNEHFRTWGISDDVRRASPVPPEFGNAGIVIYGNLLGDYHYDWFQRSAVRPAISRITSACLSTNWKRSFRTG